MRVLFVGTPDFARDSLEAIENAGHEICGVITAPDKPKGRGMQMAMSEVKEYAISKGYKIFQPERIRKNPEFIEEIKALNADIACVVVYGKILPLSFLEIFKHGCINVHPSLLPKYRGAAPIQWAIINGDEKTGVCTMYLDVGMDDGDVILREETEIGSDETAGELWDRLSKIGAKLLVQTLDNLEKGIVIRTKQNDNFTIAPKLEKELSKIDWDNKTAIQIKNLVRGLTPGMGTYTLLNDKKIKIWKVDVASKEELNNLNIFVSEKLKPGEVIYSSDKQGLYVYTIDGILKVLTLQAENSKRMSIGDFLRGNKIEVGDVFN